MQANCTISDNQQLYTLALVGLFVFSVVYNLLVDYLEKRGWERGITSLLVALGSGVTLMPVIWLSGFQLFVDIIGLFVASGLIMIVGSLHRYLKEREQETEAMKRASEAAND